MGGINEEVACSIQQHHPQGRPPLELDAAIKLASSIAEALYRFGQAVDHGPAEAGHYVRQSSQLSAFGCFFSWRLRADGSELTAANCG